MNWGFLVASGICALLALGALWFCRQFRREVALMAATPTSRAADVAALAPGTMVEVKGTIRCTKPMTGSFSQRLCVYAKSEIERKETRYRDGKTETHYVTESSVENHVPFYVEDASGSILVQPHGASIEAMQVYNQSGNTAAQSIVSLGMSIAGMGSQDRRYKESILAPDIPVYVLGTVQQGGAIGQAPPDAEVKEFIITHKSEESRARSSKIWAAILMIAAVLLIAGAVWALWAAFKYV
jgi:hypothetical protein